MAKLKKGKRRTFATHATETGMSEFKTLMVTQRWILETRAKCINVGIVTRRENFMRQLMMILSMMVLNKLH